MPMRCVTDEKLSKPISKIYVTDSRAFSESYFCTNRLTSDSLHVNPNATDVTNFYFSKIFENFDGKLTRSVDIFFNRFSDVN